MQCTEYCEWYVLTPHQSILSCAQRTEVILVQTMTLTEAEIKLYLKAKEIKQGLT